MENQNNGGEHYILRSIYYSFVGLFKYNSPTNLLKKRSSELPRFLSHYSLTTRNWNRHLFALLLTFTIKVNNQ